MNWYDELTDEQIEQLKSNNTPDGLLSGKEQLIFRRIDHDDLEKYLCGDEWIGFDEADHFSERDTYRLKQEWEKPNSLKTAGRWEYCRVFEHAGVWCFTRGIDTHTLAHAFSIVGFDGIEFKERPERFFRHIPTLQVDQMVTPLRVRFWVEK